MLDTPFRKLAQGNTQEPTQSRRPHNEKEREPNAIRPQSTNHPGGDSRREKMRAIRKK